MRVLLHTMPFYPKIGGIESVSEMIATEMSHQGHEISLVTQTAAADAQDDRRFPFRVIRNPSFREWRRAIRGTQVYLQFNVSLKGLLPWVGTRRPLVISHHGWYGPACMDDSHFGRETAGARVKKMVARRFATNLSCSRAVALQLRLECAIVPNPYRDDLFRPRPEIARDRDLVFLGRLVSDKGCDLILDALSMLAADGLRPTLDFIGAGPEQPLLEAKAAESNLSAQIRFAGPMRGEALARELNRYQIMVIPSRVLEGFGVVALEGIASGCVVVGADAGGLPEAIGAAGRIFPMGDAPAMARQIKDLLGNRNAMKHHQSHAAEHLQRHTAARAAAGYGAVCEKALGAQ